jgi:hypothetical protein
MQRAHLTFAGLAALLAVGLAPIAAHAAAPTVAALGDPGFLPGTWANAVQSINTILNNAVTSSVYSTWTRNMLAVALITWWAYIFWQYIKGDLGVLGLVEPAAKTIIILLIKATYSSWTFYSFAGFYQLGDVIENAMLQTTGLFGPGVFLLKVVNQFQLSSSGNILTVTVMSVFMYMIAAGMGFLLTVATYLSIIWPTLIYMLAKLIGPIFFMALPLEQLSFLFDGWFKLFVYACVYSLIARVVIIICAYLFGSILGTSYGGGVTGTITTIPVENAAAFGMIMTLYAASLLFIFGAGGFTAFIVGGSNIGMSRAIGQAAKLALRVFK